MGMGVRTVGCALQPAKLRFRRPISETKGGHAVFLLARVANLLSSAFLASSLEEASAGMGRPPGLSAGLEGSGISFSSSHLYGGVGSAHLSSEAGNGSQRKSPDPLGRIGADR